MATSFCHPSSPGLEVSCILFFVYSFLILLPLSESLYFNITRFEADTKNIRYSGDVVTSNGAIYFNSLNYLDSVGQAIYAHTITIWDRKSRKVSDFTTRFTFKIDTRFRPPYGHGLSFFLAPVGFRTPPNSAAGFLGLFNATNTDSSHNQIIAIEFDSFSNPEWDPPYEHVGINKNWISSVNYTFWNASLHSGDSADALLSYNATTQILRLFWSYGSSNDPRENNSLSYKVDLSEVLPERVTIGFSASTGTNSERHILQNWEFSSSLTTDAEDHSTKWKLTMVITVPLGVLILGGIVAYWIYRRRQRKPTQKSLETITLTSMNEDLEKVAVPKRFSYHDLTSATNNFSDDRKLGKGGFGCVYKGYLSREGISVAVKKNSQGSYKQGKKEYMTEVKIISSLRHRNLVRLIGWCHDQTQFMLVYEFMPNGSLDSHLFGKKSPLEWAVRYKIAMGLASALLYLHEGWEQCIVHRDIKTSNIMLDSEFNVKLGDFGLARLRDHELDPQTTGLAGTLGYLAPEYVTTGRASKESDMYSFGVVALEVASGRKATDSVDPKSYLGLVQWVWDLFGKGELLKGADQKMNDKFDAKQVECLMMVGLWSAHPDRSLRPSIRQAIQVLKFESAAPNLPMKMPVATYCTTTDVPQVNSGGATMTYASIDHVR